MFATAFPKKRLVVGAGLILVVLLGGPSAAPAADEEATKAAGLEEQWTDLLHYINVARPELAASFGQAILDNPEATPKAVYLLSVKSPQSLATLRKGESLAGMKEIVQTLQKKIEDGYKDWRTDAGQIEESIQMLAQGLRAYQVGKQRLQESGEYAIPLLIQKLLDPKTDKQLKERIVTMLPEMGRCAVRPYSVALQSNDLDLVMFLAGALGRIEYPSALPRLREALLRKDLQSPDNPTRKAVLAAMLACSGGDRSVVNKPPAELFFQLAEQYYDRSESLLPDPKDAGPTALVWFWREGTGLEARPVPTPILCDIYAMRMARLALKYDSSFYPAVPLWLSACIRREIDLPKGAKDTLWGEDKPKADFYALASSPRYLQAVLARALKDDNAAIARRVIQTMGRNTGAPSLVKPIAGGAQPLVAAMGYPDKNVRFLAAETLALAMPTETFEGCEVVTSLLVEALRQQGKKYALVVVQDAKRRNETLDAVRAAGFEAIDEPDVNNLLVAARKETGLDVVFVGSDVPADAVVNTFRRQAVFHYLPIVIHKSTKPLRDLAKQDGKIVLLEEGKTSPAEVAQALKNATALSAGKPLSEKQATDWTLRAARAVRAIGQRDNVVYDISQTGDALADVLKRNDAALQTAAAQALAVLRAPKAQQAIIDLALGQADEKVRIAAFQAACESVRRFGAQATDAQVRQTVDLVSKATGSQELLEAAAQLLGCMNLPSEKIPALIESTESID